MEDNELERIESAFDNVNDGKDVPVESVAFQICENLRRLGYEAFEDDFEAETEASERGIDDEWDEWCEADFLCESDGDERAPHFHPFEWHTFGICSYGSGENTIFYVTIE